MARTAPMNDPPDLAAMADRVGDTHEPEVVEGARHRAILVPEEEWLGLLATIELSRVPGLVDSINEAAKEPREEMTRLEDVRW